MSEWIDASKELPKEDGRYLAYWGTVFIVRFLSPQKKWKKENSDNGLDQVVSHWMPLPEPPKK
jgi:hypothetical protein